MRRPVFLARTYRVGLLRGDQATRQAVDLIVDEIREMLTRDE